MVSARRDAPTPVRRRAPHPRARTQGSRGASGSLEHGIGLAEPLDMNVRSVVVWGFALAAAPLLAACSSSSSSASNPNESSDGAAPDGAWGGGSDSGVAMSGSGSSSGGSSGSGSSSGSPSSSGSSSVDSGSMATGEDSGSAQVDSGGAEASSPWDGGCIRPPYQTTNECTGIGMPGGPVIPSCSVFNSSGQLVCPMIPGCTVVPDPSGQYCTGDNVTCGLSDCGHICILPNWDPCYDVATGACLEGC